MATFNRPFQIKFRHLITAALASSMMLAPWTEALAQSGTVTLPEINVSSTVVSATTVPTPSEQIGSSVTVITREQIEASQRRTMPDLLMTVPGLNVVQQGGPGGLTSVLIRGANSNHTKVLIDGIDVSDPSNPTRVFDLGQLLTTDIERVEVLRGPQSGLYGADALGGVISITTKAGSGPPKGFVSVEGGSFGTHVERAAISGSDDKFNYAFSATNFHSSDTPVTPPELLPPGRKAIGDRYDNQTYTTKLGYKVTPELALNMVARYTESELRFTSDDFTVFPPVPNATQSLQLQRQIFARSEAVWTSPDGRFQHQFGASVADLWTSNIDPNPGATFINKGLRDKYDWRSTVKLMEGQTLIVGAEEETERLNIPAVSAKNSNAGGFVELQSEFAKRFFIAANVRHDVNEAFGGHTTWRIAPALITPVTETKIKGSIGTGFKAPTLNQLFVDNPAFNFFANPNLRPEESLGYDIGFEQPVPQLRARFGATWYHNDIKNLIQFALIDPINFIFSLENIGRATTQGVEAFFAIDLTDRLKLRTDYTLTEARDDITGAPLVRRPKHKISATGIWNPIDPLTLTGTVLHVSSWYDFDRFGLTPTPFETSPYTVVNIAANYTINPNLKAFARVDNLFNEHYQNPIGFLRPGIGAYAGLRMNN